MLSLAIMRVEISTSRTVTPYNKLPILLTIKSLNRKLFRDQYCIECGHPFMAVSDKVVAIADTGLPIEMMRGEQRIIEARCRHSNCQQHYRVEF